MAPGQEQGIETYLGFAKGHGETSDTQQWIGDLEDMLRVAWRLLTPEQQRRFRDDPEILAIVEAAGETSPKP
jgi:hypothetical protein